MKVLAMDPGKATGFALWDDKYEGAWHDEWPHSWDTLQEQFEAGVDVLVCESFKITANTARKSQHGLMSVELIGIGRFLAHRYQKLFVLQDPGSAKIFCDDKKLKAMGMYTKGVDHPRDATRHLLLYLSTERIINLSDLRAALDQ